MPKLQFYYVYISFYTSVLNHKFDVENSIAFIVKISCLRDTKVDNCTCIVFTILVHLLIKIKTKKNTSVMSLVSVQMIFSLFSTS